MNAKRTNPRPARGLTLVELTIGFAGAAVVLAATLPALSAARQDGRVLTSLDKLGRIMRASLIYANADPNELAIPIGHGDASRPETAFSYYGWGGKSGRGTSTHVFLRDSFWAGVNGMGGPHRPLNTILYKDPIPYPPVYYGIADWGSDNRLDLDAYHAPADDGFPGLHHRGWRDTGLSSYNYYGTSYMANCLWLSDPSAGTLRSNSPYGRPLSTIPNPTNTIVYLENAGRYALFATNPNLNQSGCYWGTGLYAQVAGMVAHGWNDTPFMFHTAFADGHVDLVHIEGHGRVPTPANMPAECANGACDCLLIRGLDWQMDTLPADFAPTPHKQPGGGSGADFDIVPLEDGAGAADDGYWPADGGSDDGWMDADDGWPDDGVRAAPGETSRMEEPAREFALPHQTPRSIIGQDGAAE